MIDPKELSEETNGKLQKMATMFEEIKMTMTSIKAENEDHYKQIMYDDGGRRSLSNWYSEMFGGSSKDIVDSLRAASIDVELMKQKEADKALVVEWISNGCGEASVEVKQALARKVINT